MVQYPLINKNMDENKWNHHRHSIRLQGYDYSEEGSYFVTIVTHQRKSLFGKVVDGEMVLNNFGEIAREEWERSATIREEIEININEFTIMPNHIHGIVWIFKPDISNGRGDRPVAPTRPSGPQPKSLGAFVAGYKAVVTKRINQLRASPRTPVWQLNYYDHIIRSEKDYDNIVFYIETNPSNWLKDEEFSD